MNITLLGYPARRCSALGYLFATEFWALQSLPLPADHNRRNASPSWSVLACTTLCLIFCSTQVSASLDPAKRSVISYESAYVGKRGDSTDVRGARVVCPVIPSKHGKGVYSNSACACYKQRLHNCCSLSPIHHLLTSRRRTLCYVSPQ